MTSFRNRIRWSTLFLIALLLATFSALLYGSLSTLLYRHVDANLLSLAQVETKQVELTTGRVELLESKRDHDDDDDDGHESHETDREVHEFLEAIRSSVVLDTDGNVVWTGQAVVGYEPSARSILARAGGGKTVYETIETANRASLRRISYPIPVNGEVRYILQTEASLEFVKETLRWLLAALAGVAALVLALAWLGSGWLAREALVPVDALSRTAGNVSGNTLGTRLVLDAPYAEFQQLASAFNGMLERLHRVFEAQRRFVADAAHELKTPLTAIKGNLEVTLQKARTADEYREAVIGSLGGVERLMSLTRSLLTLARFAGDRPPVQLQPLALEPALQEVLEDLAVLAQDRGLHLTADFEPVPAVPGDAAQLRQLVINLLDNAIRHTPVGGSIHLRLRQQGDRVAIVVEDSGPGIEPQHLPHVFDRFYRIDSARDRASGGTGLGLAIVNEIAEAHGGRVQVKSEVGTGTTFTVLIPVSNEAGARTDKAQPQSI